MIASRVVERPAGTSHPQCLIDGARSAHEGKGSCQIERGLRRGGDLVHSERDAFDSLQPVRVTPHGASGASAARTVDGDVDRCRPRPEHVDAPLCGGGQVRHDRAGIEPPGDFLETDAMPFDGAESPPLRRQNVGTGNHAGPGSVGDEPPAALVVDRIELLAPSRHDDQVVRRRLGRFHGPTLRAHAGASEAVRSIRSTPRAHLPAVEEPRDSGGRDPSAVESGIRCRRCRARMAVSTARARRTHATRMPGRGRVAASGHAVDCRHDGRPSQLQTFAPPTRLPHLRG